ncbi:hypothetical protein M513_13913, partial [Trichuris suis]
CLYLSIISVFVSANQIMVCYLATVSWRHLEVRVARGGVLRRISRWQLFWRPQHVKSSSAFCITFFGS